MTINTALLIASPTLQDYFVDKTLGTPLAGGIVTLYQDSSRSLLKNWFYQTGAPGAYSYIPLDNPLTLSSVGTIQDPNGNDVIPFFYPYDEDNSSVSQAYYVTVYSATAGGTPATLQFTRENFPFVAPSSTPSGVSVPTYQNLVVNGQFWRNVGSQDVSSQTSYVLAPDQHENLTTPDIRWIKNKTGATDAIAFNTMASLGVSLQNDVTPEYYLNVQCTGATTGETTKCIQIPIASHLATLQNQTATVVFHAQNVSGNPHNILDVNLYQFAGTGASIQPVATTLQSVTLNSTFQKYSYTFTVPSAPASSTLGVGGDDALFLQLQFPLNSTFNINIALPQFYLSDTVPTNSFKTYDTIAAVVNSPRTGQIKMTMNTLFDDVANYGWVALDDGTIGSTSSVATTRHNNDTWPLYAAIYCSVSDTYAPVTGGRTAPGNTITAAYTDFAANKPMALTKQLGRLIASIGLPSSGNNVGTTWALGQTTGNELQTLVAANIPPFTATLIAGSYTYDNGPSTEYSLNRTGTTVTTTITPTPTSSQAFNIQDPVVYYKILMKL